MSKKHKIKRRISGPVPERSSETQTVSVPAPAKPDSGGTTLILFTRKTNIFLLILLILYIGLSSLKIHTSNIGNWDTFWGLPESESVIVGKPRFIRMDEWMISTPAAIGQYYAGMPLKNESVGDLNTPVIWGLPVKDISTLLRPNHWSYFIFDSERAFAFAWNFKIFSFLTGTFLLLMLLTGNKFWLSLTGTFFLFLSGGVQWWSYFIADYMSYLNGIFISFVYILYNKKLWPLIIASLIFVISTYGFMFNLYPPFQIPLAYLYLFLFIGFLWQRKNFGSIKENLTVKVIVFSIALIILGGFLYHYFNLVKGTYTLMMNTVYPGKRISTGGDVLNGKIFSEFLGMFMTDTSTPKYWGNVCEASSFVMFFPIVFYGMAYYFIKAKKTDPLLIALSIYLILGLIYLLIGIPVFLSKITLMSLSPTYRACPIIAAANCMLLFCYLGSPKMELRKEKPSWKEFVMLVLACCVFAAVVILYINKIVDNFFTTVQLAVSGALVVITYLLIRYKYLRFAKPALYAVLIGMVIANAGVNPVTKGLDPLLENPLVKDSKEIHDKDPSARWILFGDTRLSHLLKSAGINVFNCVKLVPPLNDMKVLDPPGRYDSVYNRYAWMTVAPLIGQADTVVFRLTNNDGYTIYIDPCSPKLKQLRVDYFVFEKPPSDTEIPCMARIKESQGLFYYKRKDKQ